MAIIFFWLPMLLCWAHPFHTCLTEMDWNPQTRSWEVGLRIDANDLESAIRQHFGGQFLQSSKFSLEDEAATEGIQAYIAQRFRLLPINRALDPASIQEGQGGSPPALAKEGFQEPEGTAHAEMRWMGHEMEGSWVWLYFELVGPELNQLTVVRNSVLGEINEDQINILAIRQGSLRYSLQTSARRWWAELQKAPEGGSSDDTPAVR
jgi:hypothetical protein